VQGEVWWADLPQPIGSEPGYRRPVIIVQNESFNRSTLHTVVCVIMTTNLRWADLPGHVVLPTYATGLPRDSVAIVSQIMTIDKGRLIERVGLLPGSLLDAVLRGIGVVLEAS
jgi:mRNA interferase MazF